MLTPRGKLSNPSAFGMARKVQCQAENLSQWSGMAALYSGKQAKHTKNSHSLHPVASDRADQLLSDPITR